MDSESVLSFIYIIEEITERFFHAMDEKNMFLTLPPYREIPDVGLYLNQVVKYLTDCVGGCPGISITDSMVSNYVKQKLVPNPVRKEYSRDHLVLLLFIAIVKNVLSLEDIRLLLALRREKYTVEEGYNLFRARMQAVLPAVFEGKELPKSSASDDFALTLFDSVIITAARKIYLDYCFYKLSGKKTGPSAGEEEESVFDRTMRRVDASMEKLDATLQNLESDIYDMVSRLSPVSFEKR